MVAEYAIYKGDKLLIIGTAEECVAFMGWQCRKTINYYMSPAYERKVAKRKNAKNYITVTRLEE